MPPALITTLPTELLIELYKSLHNMEDVTALSRALPRFHDVWCKNTVTISDAVFSRTMESYDDACELVKIQQKLFERDHGDDNGHHDPYLQALERNKLIVSNAHHCLKFYEKKVSLGPSGPCTDSLRTPSSKLYYNICMLVLTEEDTSAQSSYLASRDLETLEAMLELVGEDVFSPTTRSERTWLKKKDPLQFGSEKFGGYAAEDALVNAQARFKKHILALERAQEVGNGVENA